MTDEKRKYKNKGYPPNIDDYELVDVETRVSQLETLSDPQRARIYFYVEMNERVSTEELLKVTGLAKSTLSYHLTKLVEKKLLAVEIPLKGQYKKIYKKGIKNKVAVAFSYEKVMIEKDHEYIKNYLKIIALDYQILANRAKNALQNAKEIPLEDIIEDEEKNTTFTYKNKKGFIPAVKQVQFGEKLARKFQIEFRNVVNKILEEEEVNNKNSKKEEIQYIANLSFFPLFD